MSVVCSSPRSTSQKEILSLKAELEDVSHEYQIKDGDDETSWRTSANSEYTTREDSVSSYSSRYFSSPKENVEEEVLSGFNPSPTSEI